MAKYSFALNIEALLEVDTTRANSITKQDPDPDPLPIQL